jgi:hypothetical protein
LWTCHPGRRWAGSPLEKSQPGDPRTSPQTRWPGPAENPPQPTGEPIQDQLAWSSFLLQGKHFRTTYPLVTTLFGCLMTPAWLAGPSPEGRSD